MRILIVAAVLSLIAILGSAPVHAEDLAVCGSVSGKAYYAEKGVVSKENRGWNDDAISGGKTTLVKLGEDQYDILFLDSTGSIKSVVQQSGTVLKLRQGVSDFTFLVYYPGDTIEIYTFLVDNAGIQQVILMQSKGGDSTYFHKSAVFVGECNFIKFD